MTNEEFEKLDNKIEDIIKKLYFIEGCLTNLAGRMIFFEKLKQNYIELEKMHQRQMTYSGLLSKAVCDIADRETMKNIVSRHFELMAIWDKENL